MERESGLSTRGWHAGAAAGQEGALPASAHLQGQEAAGKAMACRKTMMIEQLNSKPRQALVLFRMDFQTSVYAFVGFKGLLAPNFEC